MTTADLDPDLKRAEAPRAPRLRRRGQGDVPGSDTTSVMTRIGSTSVPLARTPGEATPPAAAPTVDTGAAAAVSLRDPVRLQWLKRHAVVLASFDAAVALLATCVALAVTDPAPSLRTWVLALLAGPALWVGSLVVGRTYDPRNLASDGGDYARILSMGVRWIGLAGVVALAVGSPFARVVTLVALPVMALGSLGVHTVGHHAELRARRRGTTEHRALVLGSERAVAEMVRRLSHRDDHGFRIVGALVDRSRHDTIEGIPVVGAGHDFRRALEHNGADTLVVAAWSLLSQQELRRMSWELEDSNIDILVTPNVTDVAGSRISVRPVVGLPLLQVDRPEFSGLRRLVKGAFDRSVAAFSLLLLSPVMLALVIAVRLDSPGPALYRQVRVGRLGTTFPMLKLRTMYQGADQLVDNLRDQNDMGDGPLFKMKSDPRVTRVGALLRRFSIDELPQLWNVARGQMSLVGPRPPLPEEVAAYPDDVRRRLLVKPGMTGLWQVSGRSDLDWEESVRLDLYYVDNWSFLLDLSMLAKTFRAVFLGRGAY